MSRLASSSVDAVGLHERAPVGVEALRAAPRRGSRRAALRQRSTGAVAARTSSADLIARSNATQAITLEWVKCRRGPRTSQMPVVGLVPAALDEVDQRALERPRASSSASMPARARLVQRVDHLAVDVELELAVRRRCRCAPAREPS